MVRITTPLGIVRIVRARAGDRGAIVRLIRDSHIGDGRDVDDCVFWVVRHGSAVVGCAGLQWHGADAAILTHCVVRKEYRRCGIGSAFVRLRLAEARRRGKRIAALCTMFWRFRHYRSFGFVIRKRRDLPEDLRSFPQFTSVRYRAAAVMVLPL